MLLYLQSAAAFLYRGEASDCEMKTARTPPSNSSSTITSTPITTTKRNITEQQSNRHEQLINRAKRFKQFEYEGYNRAESSDDEKTMDTKAILDAIKESSDAQMSKFDDLSEKVTTQIEKVNKGLEKVSDRVDRHDKDIDFLKRHVNDMEQEKLAADIEITGIAKADIDKHQQNLTAFAREVIASFGIQFDHAVVQHAFVRTVAKANFSVIVVMLSSVEAKTHIMKKKREAENPRKIFFDHRLTNMNRALVTATRKAMKESGWKVFVNRGRIFIASDNEKHRIVSFEDIEKFKHQNPAAMSVDA